MAYKTGTAGNYKELMVALRGFLIDAKKAWNVVAGGGNTGNGIVSMERASTSPVDETWTLTATSASNFTVTGSVSGAQAAATVGTPYDNAIVAFTIIAGSAAFVSSDEFTFDVADGLGATELYTELNFDLDFDGDDGYELYLMGVGTAGADEILTCLRTYYDTGDDYHNWKMAGMTGYSASVDLSLQPGVTQGRLPRMLLWNDFIEYWFIANGRRYIVVAKVSSVYECMYAGFILPFGLPTQFPYPLAIGGSAVPTTVALDHRYSSIASNHRAFTNPFGGSASVIPQGTFDTTTSTYANTLKFLQGTSWVGFKNKTSPTSYGMTNVVWPYCSGIWSPTFYNDFSLLLRENIDGSYPVFPLVPIVHSPNNGIAGELQGCFAVPGIGGIAAEDTFTISGDTYVAFPCVPNAGRSDFWALKLE